MSTLRSTKVAASEAGAHFAELLGRVEGGEEVVLTRLGSAVARIVPVDKPSAPERRRAIEAMRELAKRNRLDGLRISDLIEEGRR